ncbi:unnamed protein product, partial [Hapterophycus canaliculatus]
CTPGYRFIRVLGGILTAVDFIHSRGFLHRDIEPENILISTSGEGVLADFGLTSKRNKPPLRATSGPAHLSARLWKWSPRVRCWPPTCFL